MYISRELRHLSDLFPGKDVLVEVELQLFVGNVDAELLEGIDAKVFKAKDVQNSNVLQARVPTQSGKLGQAHELGADPTCTACSQARLKMPHLFLGGLSVGLILFTIQLNSRP